MVKANPVNGNVPHLYEDRADGRLVACLCRDGGRSFMQGGDPSVLVDGRDGGIAGGPCDSLIGGIPGQDGCIEHGNLALEEFQRSLVQGNRFDGNFFILHDEGTVCVFTSYRSRDGRFSCPHGGYLTVLVDSCNPGVAGRPCDGFVGRIVRLHRSDQRGRLSFSKFQRRLVQGERFYGNVPLHHGNSASGCLVTGFRRDGRGSFGNGGNRAVLVDSGDGRVAGRPSYGLVRRIVWFDRGGDGGCLSFDKFQIVLVEGKGLDGDVHLHYSYRAGCRLVSGLGRDVDRPFCNGGNFAALIDGGLGRVTGTPGHSLVARIVGLHCRSEGNGFTFVQD